MPLETLLALNYNSFILTVGIIGVDSHARDMYGDSHSQGTCVLLEIPSMHKLVQYFQSLYTCRNVACSDGVFWAGENWFMLLLLKPPSLML